MECKVGDLIGAECAKETEPYIVCEVVSPFAKWKGRDGKSWMGRIVDGDEYITCRKYQQDSELRYTKCGGEKADFYLLATDVRMIFKKAIEVKQFERARRETAKVAAAAQQRNVQLDSDEMDTLKLRVWIRSRHGD